MRLKNPFYPFFSFSHGFHSKSLAETVAHSDYLCRTLATSLTTTRSFFLLKMISVSDALKRSEVVLIRNLFAFQWRSRKLKSRAQNSWQSFTICCCEHSRAEKANKQGTRLKDGRDSNNNERHSSHQFYTETLCPLDVLSFYLR